MEKNKLNEYKNVSDKVTEFSLLIYNNICDYCNKLKKKESKFNGKLFVEDEFQISKNICSEWIFNGINELNVQFLIYFVESRESYNDTMRFIGSQANSFSDYEIHTLKIVSGFINGEPSSDFLSTIFHEVNHLFEFDNGRGKRVALYNKAVELISNKESTAAQYVGYAIYFSFQHEIDAFVHQFYGFLVQEEPLHLTFEQLLNYSMYRSAYDIYKKLLSIQNSQEVIHYINELGYNKRDFFKRIKFSLKKMKAKMHNAYVRFERECSPMTEGKINRILLEALNRHHISDKYGYEIEEAIETIYNF